MAGRVRVVIDNGGFAGHAYYEISEDGQLTRYYGYNPLNPPAFPPTFEGAGTVLDESERALNPQNHNVTSTHASDWIYLTDQGMQSLFDYISEVALNPGTYNAANNNCVDFVQGGLRRSQN